MLKRYWINVIKSIIYVDETVKNMMILLKNCRNSKSVNINSKKGSIIS